MSINPWDLVVYLFSAVSVVMIAVMLLGGTVWYISRSVVLGIIVLAMAAIMAARKYYEMGKDGKIDK